MKESRSTNSCSKLNMTFANQLLNITAMVFCCKEFLKSLIVPSSSICHLKCSGATALLIQIPTI